MRDNELIEDREVIKLEDDLLGHRAVVDQLTKLVLSVPTPSNIALYGAWGSGKSGIGNLLADRLKQKPGVKFARFDAFKYAENPLRRNFVSVVANALGNKRARYHQALYSGTTNLDLSISKEKIWKLLGIFALIVLVALGVSSLVVLGLSTVQKEPAFEALIDSSVDLLTAAIVPATLLTAIIGLVGKTFFLERRSGKVESDEEFEQLLTDLVRDSGAKRVVIFVDELDRCASSDVVETLNAVRTFLGVDKCVFVIAADQQVLEKALSESLSQPTPSDSINPYYSAGSSYLDKVFQYQVVVPPLLPQSVTSFAVSLVKGRPGVWQDINIDLIASILVPAHVRSPRRVKNLLNSFVLSYRLAKSRQTSGQLDIDVDNHVDELAKLVCLRVEFPLFARDLASDSNLSNYVLEIADIGSKNVADVWKRYPYVDPRIQQIAQGYAGQNRQVDRLLVEADYSTESSESTQISKVHGQQLLDYLKRTRMVEGPTKALIHLESTASIFGLDYSLVEQIESSAQNADVESVKELFQGLEPGPRLAVVSLLLEQMRAAVGLEIPNIAESLLSLVAHDAPTISALADSIAADVAPVVELNPHLMESPNALGAWELAMHSSRFEAGSLGRAALRVESLATDDNFLRIVLKNARQAIAIDAGRVREVLLQKFSEPNVATLLDILASINPLDRHAVFELIGSPVSELIADPELSTRYLDKSSEDIEDDYVFDPGLLVKELGRVLRDMGEDSESVHSLTLILLASDTRIARDVVDAALNSIKITDYKTAQTVYGAMLCRAPKAWPKWLEAIPGEAILDSQEAFEKVSASIDKLWQYKMAAERPGDEDFAVAASALSQFLDTVDQQLAEAVHLTAVRLEEAVRTADDIGEQQKRVDFSALLVRSGLSTPTIMAEAEIRTISNTLALDLDKNETESVLATYVITTIQKIFAAGIFNEEKLTQSACTILLEALNNNEWLSQCDHARMRTVIAAQVFPALELFDIELPEPQELTRFKEELSESAFEDFLYYWLNATSATPNSVLMVLASELELAPSSKLLNAISLWRSRLDSLAQFELVKRFIVDSQYRGTSSQVLHAMGIAAIPDKDLMSLLIDRYRNETNNMGRKEVLDLWQLGDISEARAKEKGITHILIPLVDLNQQAASYALQYLEMLVSPVPSNVRGELKEALVKAARVDSKLKGRVDRILLELGFQSPKRFSLRKK